MNVDELRKLQAEIRLQQRRYIDEIHVLTHEGDRDEFYRSIGGTPPRTLIEILERIHELVHLFMRGMDKAILIHRRIAELEGRDPSEVDSALWPVRSFPEKGPTVQELKEWDEKAVKLARESRIPAFSDPPPPPLVPLQFPSTPLMP